MATFDSLNQNTAERLQQQQQKTPAAAADSLYECVFGSGYAHEYDTPSSDCPLISLH